MMLKDRCGMTLAFPLLFLILIACSALVLDIGRANMVRAKMQTIADASALAGAMTAEVVREPSQFEVLEKEDGEGEEIIEIPGEVTLKIKDKEKAHRAALKAEQANGGGTDFWDKVMSRYELKKKGRNLKSDETGWAGMVSGEKSYTTETRANLRPGFLSFLGMKGVTVYTSGTGDAVMLLSKDSSSGGE